MKRLQISIDGVLLDVSPGTTVAAAMIETGRLVVHRSTRLGHPRGMFCGMGVCFACLLSVDGRPNVRACLTEVKDGMVVETHRS
ncbi:MAG: (2Fe-2S)-binding protein [bacterium]|nr:(2Fe-2S)-binding protein [bacterium]MDE0240438.1 (2Fe-2S)-binding protein [bacterium]MDE0415406.1 (2Fe-2S)-binding protein [bacterium]